MEIWLCQACGLVREREPGEPASKLSIESRPSCWNYGHSYKRRNQQQNRGKNKPIEVHGSEQGF